MERAGEAMKQIHGKLTPEKVDETMYASQTDIWFILCIVVDWL